MDALVGFFVANVPTRSELLFAGPPCLLWATLALTLAGLLKRRRGVATPYTRKTFHFLIFTSAAALQVIGGTRLLCLFGAATTAVIFWAVVRGEGDLLYEAIARETDAPHRTYYIVLPYLATFVGGVAANVLCGDLAVVGYLVTGLGDAVGEPVGTYFGRHRYRVPSPRGLSFERSVEGSAAVLLTSSLAALIGTVALGIPTGPATLAACAGIGAAAAVIEGFCPHGWDNTPLQVVPALLAQAGLG